MSTGNSKSTTLEQNSNVSTPKLRLDDALVTEVQFLRGNHSSVFDEEDHTWSGQRVPTASEQHNLGVRLLPWLKSGQLVDSTFGRSLDLLGCLQNRPIGVIQPNPGTASCEPDTTVGLYCVLADRG
jgi:hypothetical protein